MGTCMSAIIVQWATLFPPTYPILRRFTRSDIFPLVHWTSACALLVGTVLPTELRVHILHLMQQLHDFDCFAICLSQRKRFLKPGDAWNPCIVINHEQMVYYMPQEMRVWSYRKGYDEYLCLQCCRRCTYWMDDFDTGFCGHRCRTNFLNSGRASRTVLL